MVLPDKRDEDIRLLPCPFCGSQGIVLIENQKRQRRLWIECTTCSVSTRVFAYYDDGQPIEAAGAALRTARQRAAAAWNRRPDHAGA